MKPKPAHPGAFGATSNIYSRLVSIRRLEASRCSYEIERLDEIVMLVGAAAVCNWRAADSAHRPRPNKPLAQRDRSASPHVACWPNDSQSLALAGHLPHRCTWYVPIAARGDLEYTDSRRVTKSNRCWTLMQMLKRRNAS